MSHRSAEKWPGPFSSSSEVTPKITSIPQIMKAMNAAARNKAKP